MRGSYERSDNIGVPSDLANLVRFVYSLIHEWYGTIAATVGRFVANGRPKIVSRKSRLVESGTNLRVKTELHLHWILLQFTITT